MQPLHQLVAEHADHNRHQATKTSSSDELNAAPAGPTSVRADILPIPARAPAIGGISFQKNHSKVMHTYRTQIRSYYWPVHTDWLA